MKHNYCYKWTAYIALLTCLVMFALPAAAQDDYGVGVEVEVPRVSPGTLTMDGVMDEPIWDVAASFDLLQYANFFTEDITEPDLVAEGRALYTEDTLYVFVQVLENELYVNEEEVYESDQILIGVDGTHAGDDQVDGEYGGWPDNAPDQGPTTYKVYLDGITLNWGFDDIDPVVEGWVRGEVFRDDDLQEWGVEMAIYVPQIEPGAQIGFNIGGAQANAEMGFAYGFYSWQALEEGSAGGDVMNNAGSFATLTMREQGGGGDGYGTGVVVDIPRVDGSQLVLDGNADEGEWDDAPTFDLLQFANFFTEEITEPDLAAEGRVLYDEDTLYVFVRVLDNELFVNEEEVYESDQILIGVDGTHAGDDQVDDGYGGWPDNAPDQGPTTYKIYLDGITLNWGFDEIDPVTEGWARGEVFRDDDLQEWGVEMAIYVPQIEEGADIGFNIGGAQANAEMGFAYGFYSWQALSEGSAGGDVMNNAGSFATFHMSSETVAIEEIILDELPSAFELRQNYPNPFNPATTIEFAITSASVVQLDVFDLLGQRVATLVNEKRASGTYQVTWNAEGLSSGMYLYQLRVDGDLIGTKSMTLMK